VLAVTALLLAALAIYVKRRMRGRKADASDPASGDEVSESEK
jgi:hypothetical protein